MGLQQVKSISQWGYKNEKVLEIFYRGKQILSVFSLWGYVWYCFWLVHLFKETALPIGPANADWLKKVKRYLQLAVFFLMTLQLPRFCLFWPEKDLFWKQDGGLLQGQKKTQPRNHRAVARGGGGVTLGPPFSRCPLPLIHCGGFSRIACRLWLVSKRLARWNYP